MDAYRDNNIDKSLSAYKYIKETKADVVQVLASYSSLFYGVESFTFNDGNRKNLFKIWGTIPVVYKGNTYNIPITIWLMDTHPRNAPMCFVSPTSSMKINVSQYVDHNGKIYLPYLHDWQPKKSDLFGLIQVMIVTFGDRPPVYTVRKETSTPYPLQSTMPQLGGNANPFCPYPSTTGTSYTPSSNFGQMGGLPYPSATPPNMPPSSATGYLPYPSQNNARPNYGNTNQGGTITEEHIKASLISAVNEKLMRRLHERMSQYQAEFETLRRTKDELNEGRIKIDLSIAKMKKDSEELRKNITVLQDKHEELEKSLESLEKMDGIDVDEAVVTTAPLYKQLINAYAEEAAIEDAIYYLGEALRSNIIDLDTFLKQIRQLSRKQFMLRAIMQKCRQKAGLD